MIHSLVNGLGYHEAIVLLTQGNHIAASMLSLHVSLDM